MAVIMKLENGKIKKYKTTTSYTDDDEGRGHSSYTTTYYTHCGRSGNREKDVECDHIDCAIWAASPFNHNAELREFKEKGTIKGVKAWQADSRTGELKDYRAANDALKIRWGEGPNARIIEYSYFKDGKRVRDLAGVIEAVEEKRKESGAGFILGSIVGLFWLGFILWMFFTIQSLAILVVGLILPGLFLAAARSEYKREEIYTSVKHDLQEFQEHRTIRGKPSTLIDGSDGQEYFRLYPVGAESPVNHSDIKKQKKEAHKTEEKEQPLILKILTHKGVITKEYPTQCRPGEECAGRCQRKIVCAKYYQRRDNESLFPLRRETRDLIEFEEKGTVGGKKAWKARKKK